NSRETIIAIDRVPIHMEIVERVALFECQTIPRAIRLLGHEDVSEQLNIQAGLDSLMNCARDISCAKIVPESVIDLEQFVTEPRSIKRQLPLNSRIFSTSSDLDGPCMLRLQRSVNNAGIRPFIEIDHVVEGGRLPATTKIHKCLCLGINFVH